MQIVKTLDVTPEELFDAIEASIIADIEDATGKTVSRNKLNGYHYTKKTRSGKTAGANLKTKIKTYRYPSVYEAKFTYDKGSNTTRYEVEPTEDGKGCTLTYTEDYTVNVSTAGFYGKLNLFLYERRVKKRAEDTIKSVAKYARESRGRSASALIEEAERAAADMPDDPQDTSAE